MNVPLPLSYMELMTNNWEILGQFMSQLMPIVGCSIWCVRVC
jgi:hypothetical protein